MDPTPDSSLRAVTRRYLAGYIFSAVGTGLSVPLTAVFLGEERGLSPSAIGGYYAVVAVAAIVATLVAGSVADRLGPSRPFAVAGLAQAIGTVLLITLDSTPGVYIAALVCGLGNGTFFAVQTSMLTRVFGLRNLSAVFGRQYQVSNLAIGLGALTLGALVLKAGYVGYLIGFSINALSCAVHALNVTGPVRLLAIRSGLAEKSPEVAHASRPRPFAPFLDRAFVPVIITQLCVVVFGYAQMEAAAPVVFRESAHLPLWGITLLTVANCIGVVAFQGWAIRRVEQIGPERGLRSALVVWLVAALAGLAAILVEPTWLRLVLVVAFAVIFAFGETLVAPSLQPMAAARAPHGRLGVYTAAVSLAFSLGLVIGPPLSLAFFAAFGGGWYWILIVAGTACGILAVRAATAHPVTPDRAAQGTADQEHPKVPS